MKSSSTGKSPDLDSHTLRFTVDGQAELKAGDTLIVRETKSREGSLEVAAVPEKAVRDEAAKLFS